MNTPVTAKTITAILGGAFDPIHKDHLNLALAVSDAGLAQEVWFVPSPDRWDKRLLASAQHRLNMLELALKDYPGFHLNSSEIQAPVFCGTYVLLKRFQQSFPGREFRLLTGADTYAGIPMWKDQTAPEMQQLNGKSLLREFSLIVVPRLGFDLPDIKEHHSLGYKPLHILNQESVRIQVGNASSSYIRSLQSTQELREWVPEPVAEYIRQNHLYHF